MSPGAKDEYLVYVAQPGDAAAVDAHDVAPTRSFADLAAETSNFGIGSAEYPL